MAAVGGIGQAGVAQVTEQGAVARVDRLAQRLVPKRVGLVVVVLTEEECAQSFEGDVRTEEATIQPRDGVSPEGSISRSLASRTSLERGIEATFTNDVVADVEEQEDV